MNKPATSDNEPNMPIQNTEVWRIDSHAEANRCTEEEILSVIQSSRLWLKFPVHIEAEYLDKHIPRAIRRLHVLTPLMLLLYLILISGIVVAIPEHQFWLWVAIDSWVTVAILGVFLISYFSTFNRWYQWYASCGSAVVIGVSIALAGAFPLGPSTPLSYAGVIFAVLIIYTCVGLTFPWVVTAGLLGGAIGVSLTYFMGATVNWSLLHRTYTCASILGIGLSYALENQDRKNFLNTYLLRLTVAKGEALAEQLKALSRQDSLTGLANRRHLDDILESELKRALRQMQPLTVMIIDVDYFKIYNDQLGHLAGDECLRQIAKLFLNMTKRSGELAARYGGEEFVLVYPVMNEELAEQQAIRLLEHMEILALPHPNGRLVSFSIGIKVCAPDTNLTIEGILHDADAALYSAKANGRRGYVIFDQTPEP